MTIRCSRCNTEYESIGWMHDSECSTDGYACMYDPKFIPKEGQQTLFHKELKEIIPSLSPQDAKALLNLANYLAARK